MYEIFEKTAIKMAQVQPYHTFHLVFFIGGLILSIILGYLLRNISKKKLNKILFFIGIFLLLAELYKQLFYTYYIGNGIYQWWIFPFQLCSIPMYLCLIISFIKNEKVYNAIMTFLISYNLLGGFISFFEPSGLIHDYYTLTYHAFTWHMLIIFIGVLIGFNKNIKFTIKEFKNNILVFLVLCLIAFVINIMVGGDINMFFIGPNVSSLAVFHDIANKLGWFVNNLVYIPLLTLGAFIMFYPFTMIKKDSESVYEKQN